MWYQVFLASFLDFTVLPSLFLTLTSPVPHFPAFALFLLFLCFSAFLLFHFSSLFSLTAQQERDVLYRRGSTGPQLPNNPLIYQPPPASLHGKAFLPTCVGCYLQPARQVVCISGCASLGCVWGNEMTLPVMYLAFSPVAEACLCICLAFFLLSTRIYLQTEGMWG